MQLLGHRASRLLAAWTVLGALAALLPALWMWGFTVDDALISVRYARHLASGIGWRFNVHGPSTDGVTPLPWPLLIAPFAHGDPLAVLARIQGLGVAAWVATGAGVGRAIGRVDAPAWSRAAALATMALSVPLAAYAVSGMETAVATALATGAALSLDRPRTTALLAKPSDVEHGLAYAGAACVVSLVPVLVLAPVAILRDRGAVALVLAALVQVGAIVLVGGDWMPYARLLVPVVPSLVYAAVLASRHAHPIATAVRSAVAVLLGVALVARGGTAGRTVGPARTALVATSRPWLADAHRVAALDIGWVSAATEADIVDLAGLTDPEIAALPGGHTSKRVDARFLLARAPEILLVEAPRGLPRGGLAAWQDTATPRAVEARLLADDTIAQAFTPAAWLPLAPPPNGYILLKSIK
jgi:hypothetical protein